MSSYESQKNIISAIEKVVEKKIDTMPTTNSTIGIVKDEPKGFDCEVELMGEAYKCLLPEHLHTWIQKGDIVIIQDLYGDGRSKIITGKTGTIQKDPSIVFYDTDKKRNISGREGLFDSDNQRVESIVTVKGK